MLIAMMNGVQCFFKKKKQVAEYMKNKAPVIERCVSMFLGIPKYSSKFLNTINKKSAVSIAPKLSIRNSFLGFLAKLFIVFLTIVPIQ